MNVDTKYVHVVYRKSPSAHNYFNHSRPLLMAETGTIYYVKYLYSEIAMHIISILSSESIGEYCLVIKINE